MEGEPNMGGAVPAAPRRRHVYLGVVTYTGVIEPAMGEALQRTGKQLAARGIEHTLKTWSGDALIADARNGVAASFLASDADDLVFLDYDVSWDGDELIRLIDHPVDVVAGVYRYRRDAVGWPVTWLDKPDLYADPETGLLEVAAAPTGFLRLSRHCLTRMTFYFADRAYWHENAEMQAWCLFDCGLHEGRYWGEDFMFCNRWRMTGGKVWIDPMLSLHHWGYIDPQNPGLGKKAFSGSLGDWLRSDRKAA